MRTIKFRAYIKKESVMVDVESIDFVEGYIAHENLRRDNANDLEPRSQTDPLCVTDFADLELMQFTGLLDKNGKPIFEGDIVKYVRYQNGFNNDSVPSKACISEVKWCGGIPGFAWDGYYVGEEDAPNEKVEVIGNIHENPDLLKCN